MPPLGTGAIFSTDHRDYPYASGVLPEALPASYKTSSPAIYPVLMQGQRPSCVSHAMVRLLRLYWWKKTGKLVDFSPRFLHALTSPGMADSDGRDPRRIGDALVNVGCCTTALLPNDVSLNDHDYTRVQITQAMLDEAAQYKIPAYRFPAVDQYEIRHAIYHKGAVGLMFAVGNEWYTPDWSPSHINPLRPPNPKTSQHEVAGEHWADTLEGIENSWSANWCENGFAEYDFKKYAPMQVICIDDASVDFNPSTPVFIFNKNLAFGMRNNDVLMLQKRLSVSPQTGYFGSITFAAVVKYQKAHGILPTGFVGPITRAALNTSI